MRDPLQIEVDEINALYQDALVAIGARAAQAFEAYIAAQAAAAPITGAAATAALGRASALIISARADARALSLARMSLIRALNTGAGIALVGDADKRSLQELREEFADQVMKQGLRSPLAHKQISGDTTIDMEDVMQSTRLTERSTRTPDIKRIMRQMDQLTQRYRKGEIHERAFRTQLGKLNDQLYAEVEKDVMDAGREVTEVVKMKDHRVEAWCRVAGGYDPCAFCLMLMSRGPVYRSRGKALWRKGNVGDTYHPNCRCEAVLMYRRSEYDNSDMTALNRDMERFWAMNITGSMASQDGLNYLRRWRYANRHQKVRTALAAAS